MNKLFVFGGSIWHHIIVYKLFIYGENIWNYIIV